MAGLVTELSNNSYSLSSLNFIRITVDFGFGPTVDPIAKFQKCGEIIPYIKTVFDRGIKAH